MIMILTTGTGVKQTNSFAPAALSLLSREKEHRLGPKARHSTAISVVDCVMGTVKCCALMGLRTKAHGRKTLAMVKEK